VISPLLANIALDGLEDALTARFGLKGSRQSERTKVNLIRYADDFVITGSSKELLEREVMPMVERFLATRGLELSKEKTQITHIADGLDFLGGNVRRRGRKIIITPAKKNVRAVRHRIRELFQEHRTAQQHRLIEVLNPVIRGWANYHRSNCAKRTFATLDAWIWRKAWCWARRRHLNKPAAWVRRRYFTSSGQWHWVFSARLSSGDLRPSVLRRAAQTRIRRHTKIRGDANPCDAQWAPYFAARRRALARHAAEAGAQ
jgi:RNA-directed DNA polymerase